MTKETTTHVRYGHNLIELALVQFCPGTFTTLVDTLYHAQYRITPTYELEFIENIIQLLECITPDNTKPKELRRPKPIPRNCPPWKLARLKEQHKHYRLASTKSNDGYKLATVTHTDKRLWMRFKLVDKGDRHNRYPIITVRDYGDYDFSTVVRKKGCVFTKWNTTALVAVLYKTLTTNALVIPDGYDEEDDAERLGYSWGCRRRNEQLKVEMKSAIKEASKTIHGLKHITL